MKQFNKKILAVLLSLVLMLSAGLTALAAANGDLNNDNKITTEDARKILRASIGLETLNAAGKKAADMDLDGSVTTADARLALRVAIGLEVSNGKLYENQYDVLRSGFFFTDFSVKDDTGDQAMLLAVTDKATFMRMEFSDEEMKQEFGLDAIKINLIFQNEKAYLLDPENRQYAEFPFEEMGMSADELTGMADAKDMFRSYPALSEASSKGSGKFGGVSCTVYTFNNDSGNLKVYMDGPKLLGMEKYSPAGKVTETYTFRSVALSIPTAYTAIPSGYTEGDAMEMLLLMFFGDLLEELGV
jgi:hypothetical protein